MNDIQSLAYKYKDQVIAWRRRFHENPELSHEEVETSAFIAQELRRIGLEPKENVGGHGVTAVIQGGKGPGKCICLRADIDALPITEETGLPFSSKKPGVMHACGHDCHGAILLGVAHMLYELRDQFAGTVKLLFQPSEEAGPHGSVLCIADGVLENPKVDAIAALHMNSLFPTGQMRIKDGPMMSAAAKFELTVHGKSGHAARPHQAVDSIAVLALLITAMQQVVSRGEDPNKPCVVTVGKISGGTAPNQISPSASMAGSCRAPSLEVLQDMLRKIDQIAGGITQAYGATYELHSEIACPPNINDHHMFELGVASMREQLGTEKAIVLTEPLPASEDFGEYGKLVPSVYMILGARKEGWPPVTVHNCGVKFDEDSFPYGMSVMTDLALRFLAEGDAQ